MYIYYLLKVCGIIQEIYLLHRLWIKSTIGMQINDSKILFFISFFIM